MLTRIIFVFLIATALTGCKTAPKIDVQTVSAGTDKLLQAFSVVSDSVIWVSGHGGTIARSIDGGNSFQSVVVPGADTLQFRDIHGFDELTAVLMAAGEGEKSSIWRTTDGGQTFAKMVQNQDSSAFFDSIDFWENGKGLLIGDSFDRKLYILHSADSGKTWNRLDPNELPAALPNEGAFAASGTCIQTLKNGEVRIVTGSARVPRVFVSADSGKTWAVENVRGESGEAAGWASVCGDVEKAFIFGGNLAERDTTQRNFGERNNGVWEISSIPEFNGAVYGSDWHSGRGLLAAGPGGLMFRGLKNPDWYRVDSLSNWAVAFVNEKTALSAGPKGRVLQIHFLEK